MIYEYLVLKGRHRSVVDGKTVGFGEVYRAPKPIDHPDLEALVYAGVIEHPDSADTDSGEIHGSALEVPEDSKSTPSVAQTPKRRGRPKGAKKEKAES